MGKNTQCDLEKVEEGKVGIAEDLLQGRLDDAQVKEDNL